MYKHKKMVWFFRPVIFPDMSFVDAITVFFCILSIKKTGKSDEIPYA